MLFVGKEERFSSERVKTELSAPSPVDKVGKTQSRSSTPSQVNLWGAGHFE